MNDYHQQPWASEQLEFNEHMDAIRYLEDYQNSKWFSFSQTKGHNWSNVFHNLQVQRKTYVQFSY